MILIDSLSSLFGDRADIPQTAPLPGMVANSAGGYAFPVNKWERLLRFLILGSDQGSYYASPMGLTLESVNNVIACYEEDHIRTLNLIRDISVANRAPRRLPAIIALVLGFKNTNERVRQAAANTIPHVIRTGTDMAYFIGALRAVNTNMGRVLRRGIATWYTGKSPDDLVYMFIKYKQRDDVAIHDVFNLAHVKPQTAEQEFLFRWVVRGEKLERPTDNSPFWMKRLWAAQEILRADVNTAVKLIEEYNLPREAVPTHLLRERVVWEALFRRLPLMAMIRNLNVMAERGLLDEPRYRERVIERLNPKDILGIGIHPMTLLKAYTAFREVYVDIEKTLEAAFYAAFKSVPPTGKRLVVAIDVSDSMKYSNITRTLTAHQAAAAMALIFKATEPIEPIYLAFAGSYRNRNDRFDAVMRLNLAGNLRNFMQATANLPYTSTDCSLPILWAQAHEIPVDAFIILTDNETWAGSIHPAVALAQYRQQYVSDAAMVTVAMVSNGFSIADPNDARMLDVVGFDTSAPEIINAFIGDSLMTTFTTPKPGVEEEE